MAGHVTTRLAELESVACDTFGMALEDITDERRRELWLWGKHRGRRYWDSTLSGFSCQTAAARSAVNQLTEFARNMNQNMADGVGLILFGEPGTGKDHLLAAMMKIAIAGFGFGVEWRYGGDFYNEYHDAAMAGEGRVKAINDRLFEPSILAISDAQPPAGDLSAPQIRRLRDIVELRYNDRRPVWLTTNILNTEDAHSTFTIPLWRRLRDESVVIDCCWPKFVKGQP